MWKPKERKIVFTWTRPKMMEFAALRNEAEKNNQVGFYYEGRRFPTLSALDFVNYLNQALKK
jgi:hypothetical protein